jgi:SAM-dependent methyltransferase
MLDKSILDQVDQYYTSKVVKYGATPEGVDWNGAASQSLRFQILSKVIEQPGFSILDYGCGFGSLRQYLKECYDDGYSYYGFDISAEMIDNAKTFNFPNSFFSTSITDFSPCDYLIASGIFNVRLQNSNDDWLAYILQELNTMNSLAKKGFSFNMLTSYSDMAFMKEYLYYAEPEFFFKYCKNHFSQRVSLLHDYPLYEFSVIVKK